MRRIFHALAVLALVASAAVPALAQSDTTGEIAVGARGAEDSGSLNKASEYQTNTENAVATGWADVLLGRDSLVQFDLDYRAADDQAHRFALVAGHALTFDGSYVRLRHNLRHDPLANLNGGDPNGKISESDDLDPTARYKLRFEDADVGLTYRPTGARAFSISVRGREQSRSGTHQNLSTGHCYSCHTIGQTQAIEQKMRDLTVAVAWVRPHGGIRYEGTVRSFRDDAPEILRGYRAPFQPVTTAMVFGSRVQYPLQPVGSTIRDVTDLTVGVSTEYDQLNHVVTAHWTGAKNHFDGAAAYSTVESKDNRGVGALNPGLEWEYTSLRARWLHQFNPVSAFTLRGRYEKVESDELFIDVVEQANIAGPQAGRTYADVYAARGFVADWTRVSPGDRTTIGAEAEYVHRFGDKKRQQLRVGLTARSIDREELIVTDNHETETKEYALKGQWNGRTAGNALYRLDAEWYQAEHALSYVDGACREAGEDPYYTSPPATSFPWNTLQYFELYEGRFANLTNVPTDAITLRGSTSLTPRENVSATFHGKARWASNDETQVSDWEEQVLEAGASLWWAPVAGLHVTAAADLVREDQDTHICIPLKDG